MTTSNYPLVSIIVAVYNVSKYLDRCVRSLINQSYKELEILLVDDGSTDSSGLMCDAYQKQDTRIRVVHKKNGGLSSARNAGLCLIQGSYVGFVDGDDFVGPDMYETLVKAITDHEADIAQTGYRHTDEKGRIQDEITFNEAAYTRRDEMFTAFFEQKHIHVGAWSKLYKSSIFQNIRFPEGHVFEDYAVLPNLLSVCRKYVIIGGAFYHYVHNPESITRNKVTLNVIESRLQVPLYVLKCIERIDRQYLGYAYHYICLSSIRGYNKIIVTDKIDNQTIRQYAKKLTDQYNTYYRLYRQDASWRKLGLCKKIKLQAFAVHPYFSRFIFYVLKHFIRKSKKLVSVIIRRRIHSQIRLVFLLIPS